MSRATTAWIGLAILISACSSQDSTNPNLPRTPLPALTLQPSSGPISYREGVFALRELEKKRPDLALSKSVISLRYCSKDGQRRIFVGRRAMLPKESLDAIRSAVDEQEEFEYVYEGNSKKVSLEIDPTDETPLAFPEGVEPESPQGNSGPARAGDPAWIDSPSKGTAGWFFYFNGELVCLSNHHVFCKNETTQLCTEVKLGNQKTGILLGKKRGGWDLALARVRLEDVRPEMRECQAGFEPHIVTYPTGLSQPDTVFAGDGTTYTTVGHGEPICSNLTLSCIWFGKVAYRGKEDEFRGQLAFEPRTDIGDSGSIAIRSDDTVTGLFFGRTSKYGIANPLLDVGWGTAKSSPTKGFPAFTDAWRLGSCK